MKQIYLTEAGHGIWVSSASEKGVRETYYSVPEVAEITGLSEKRILEMLERVEAQDVDIDGYCVTPLSSFDDGTPYQPFARQHNGLAFVRRLRN